MAESTHCVDGKCDNPIGDKNEQNIMNKVNSNDRLIYIGDPMCSWCWGITNHLDQIKVEYEDHLDFQLILGGLRPGGGEEWNEHFREMIKEHWHHVEAASGQPFDYSFFDRDQFNYDTEPACRAVRVVRDLAPEKEWEFYKTLQRSFYAENKVLDDLNLFEVICKELGIDFAEFQALFLSAGYKQLVVQDFVFAQQLGIRGFPSVIVKIGEEYSAVTLGYADYDTMKTRLDQILAS